ncbi:MAG: ribosome maturation factor RimM, partial [Treponema sp.]|nr:ribosome maturation factor RimM [Treponema sp.]
MTEKFVVGLAGAPFGLKGFVKVRPLSGEIDHLLKLQSLILRLKGKEEERKIEESLPAPPALLIKFTGIDSPEDAKTLRGAELLAGREQASPLGPDEYYIEDLKGLPVIAGASPAEGEVLGRVAGLIEGGGGSLVEIRLSSGEIKLVPFRKEF